MSEESTKHFLSKSVIFEKFQKVCFYIAYIYGQ